MAYINTNDSYVREYCKIHPDASRIFEELVALRNARLLQYGMPEHGGIDDVVFDISSKDWFKKVKAVQIDLLKELKRVCDENGLKLFLIYGSLLGAVRSGGMLDGDDDIDVALFREDYDRLARLSSSFTAPYFLQNNYNDDCFYGGYMKLRNSDTTAIHPQNWYVDCQEGIFIDVFPIDRCYGSKIKERLKLKKIRWLQRLLYAKSYGFFRSFKDMPLLVWKFYKYFGKLYSREALLKKLDTVFTSNDNKGEKIGIYTHYGESCATRYMASSSFADVCRMSYEGVEFFAPKGWDEILCHFYGNGYLIPGNFKKEFHAFYKADVPYKNYKKRFTSLFTSLPDRNKDLLVVGDKELLFEYRKRFPKAAYKPNRFIDAQKIEVLKEYPPDSVFIVIAAFDFLRLEDAIREFGFRNYAIYVYNRDWLFLPDLRCSKIEYKF